MTQQRSGNPPSRWEELADTGERMLPAAEGEVSFTYSRHAFAYRHALAWVEGKSVLDVGCGTGYGARILAGRARSVTAVDQSEEAIAYCLTHSAGPRIDFRVMCAEELSVPAAFDVGTCFQVIEHLPGPAAFLKTLCRAVIPAGVILITTPNVRPGHRPLERNPFHRNEMTLEEFSALLSSSFSSFQILGIAPSEAPLWRRSLRRLPLYRWGRGIRRTNPLKKVADRALDLTSFRVIEDAVATDAIDLLAVCTNA